MLVDGEPWFVAKDVCDALDLSNPSVAVSALDDDERSKFNLGRQGETNIVSEPGLYKLVMRSRKPEAKAFQRWVTHDVLPSIRRTGAYEAPGASSPSLDEIVRYVCSPDGVMRICQNWQHDRDRADMLQRECDRLAPKALAAESFIECEGTYTVTEAARLLRQADGRMSRRRLFALLRADGLMEQGSKQATAKAVQRGYLVNVCTSFTAPDGRRVAREPYALVTPKGLSWMVGRYCASQRRIPLALVEGVA